MGGIRGFNPRTGEWESNIAPPPLSMRQGSGRPPSTAELTAGFRRHHSSLWDNINDGIGSIGNFIAGAYELLRGVAEFILRWGAWIGGGVMLISLLLDGHWFLTIFLFCLLGALYIQLTRVLAALVSWVLFIPVALLRYVFYNFWSLLLVLILGGAILLNNSSIFDGLRHNDAYDRVEALAEAPHMFECTANVLYVRRSPSTSGIIMGSIFRGYTVEVTDYEGENGFAEIIYNGKKAYVSKDYIQAR